MADIHISNQVFKNQEEAKNYVREILHNNHKKNIDSSHTDFEFLHKLVERHPEAKLKIGSGISHFFIKSNQLYKSAKALFIKRIDGSEIDISFNTCIRGKSNKQEHQLFEALRVVIQPQIDDFRKQNERVCNFCGVSKKKTHVDHVIPFQKLVNDFLENNKQFETFNFDFESDEYFRSSLSNKHDELKKSWAVFHKNYAKLQILCETCNLKRPKK